MELNCTIRVNKGNLASALGSIESLGGSNGYVTYALNAYQQLISTVKKSKICTYSSPNKLSANKLSVYQGKIPSGLIELNKNSGWLMQDFDGVYNVISERVSDDDVVDPSTGIQMGEAVITFADEFSAEAADGEVDVVGAIMDAAGWFFENVVGPAIATIVDAVTSLFLGLIQLVEGLVDAVALIVGDVASLLGNEELANGAKNFIQTNYTNDVIGAAIYNFYDSALNFVGVDKTFTDYSWMNDNMRALAQETGRWVGVVALSCIVPGGGAVIGAASAGLSGAGKAAQDAFQAGGGYSVANLCAVTRGVFDAVSGYWMGGHFGAGMSWGQYVTTVKAQGFLTATKNAIVVGAKDFISILKFGVPVSSSTALMPLPISAGQVAGPGFFGRVFASLVPAAMVKGTEDMILSGLQSGFVERYPTIGTGTVTTDPVGPENLHEGETGGDTGGEGNDGGSGGGNPGGENPKGPSGDTSSGTGEENPGGDTSDGTGEENTGGETSDGTGEENTGEENPNENDNYAEGSGNQDEDGTGDPGFDDEDDQAGTDGETDDIGDGDGQDNVDDGNKEPIDEGNNDSEDSDGDGGIDDPSHPKVSVDNVGPGSVTLQDAGASLGVGALGAASVGVAGGYGTGGYGSYTPSGAGVLGDSTPQYATTTENKKEDTEEDKKNKYIFESMPATVENPALDAGLLNETPDVTLDVGEPMVDGMSQTGVDVGAQSVDQLQATQADNLSSDGASMEADKTSLNTVLGLGGISAGLGVGGVYVAQARKDTEKEDRVQNASKNLGVAGGMMGAALLHDDDDDDDRRKKQQQSTNNINQFFNDNHNDNNSNDGFNQF